MRTLIRLALVILPLLAFASKKDETGDFPLQVHIIKVDMAQGSRAIEGNGSTDDDGKYSSHVTGGGSYLYHVYTVRVDGDRREFTMTSPAMREFFKRGFWLHIGDYKGHWNKNGSLEILFHPDSNRNEMKHETFNVRAETE